MISLGEEPVPDDLEPKGEPGPGWCLANRRLIAKAIAELAWEQAFSLTPMDGDRFELRLRSGVVYRGTGTRHIWGQRTIDPDSLERVAEGRAAPAQDMARFVEDARAELVMGPSDICIYLAELAKTLIADAEIARRNHGRSAEAMLALPSLELHASLEGHPKAITSKGRMGWGVEDLRAYAPEFGAATRLFWVAVDRRRVMGAMAEDVAEGELLGAALSMPELIRLGTALAQRGLSQDRMQALPVHPWQWKNIVSVWYRSEIADGTLVPLGMFGDRFRGQISLRTLSSVDRVTRFDVKLAISILNTSCVRGIPARFMRIGPRLCAWLRGLIAADPELGRDDRVRLLEEVAGAHVPASLFAGVAESPYQYQEALGVIWRERMDSKLAHGEQALMLSALHHRAEDGRTLAQALIGASGLEPDRWLARLFAIVVVPLYHLLARYGIAPIAHGQNITLILDGSRPAGIFLKDFQGDLDLAEGSFPERGEVDADIVAALPNKRPQVIVHNIQTALFVTVFRFLSAAIADLVPEHRFYATLAEVLRAYEARHPELAARFRSFELFAATLPRVCLNRSRFAIGYAESAQRPTLVVGEPLANPLHLAEQGSSA